MSTQLINFKGCSIALGEGLIKSNFIAESIPNAQVAIITDEHVKELYGNALAKNLQEAGIRVFIFSFPPGEASKSRTTKEMLEDQMQASKLGRDTSVIALGGGVVTDLAGFVASTYCRGVPFISIPTSLLAMVDAGIGGKTGVNTQYGKNMIGTFYLPKAMLIDFQLLDTLPKAELKEGLVEMIKVAAVYDQELFDQLEQSQAMEFGELNERIKKSIELKLKVVECDYEEKEGIRHILNFGHTVGHALEKFFDYHIRHGEAIALGMIAEAFMSCEMGILSLPDFHRLANALKPYIKSCPISIPQVIDLMSLDKKSQGCAPRFVLLKEIGLVHHHADQYCDFVEEEIIISALKFIQEVAV